MTTLTQLILNRRNRNVARDLANAQDMHRTVMSLLPGDLGGSPRALTNTLFRVEQKPTQTRLLIQSESILNVASLSDGYLNSHASTTLDGLLARLQPEDTIRYSILVNPSKRDNATRETVPLSGYDTVYAWWTRKALAHGLNISGHPTSINPLPAISGTRNGTRIRHQAARIEGTATVADLQALTAALTMGIGRGKSHGLGLLTVLPVGPETA
jgi:CRISPR system Cascade subunit CasE